MVDNMYNRRMKAKEMDDAPPEYIRSYQKI